MIDFALEHYNDAASEMIPLHHTHHHEVPLFGLELNINFNAYIEGEAKGVLKLFTMRDRGKLVGYCAFFIFLHPHHSATFMAKQDVLFVHPDYRGWNAIKFIKYCDEQLKNMGIDFSIHSVPATGKWAGVLERIGYNELETNYSRRL